MKRFMDAIVYIFHALYTNDRRMIKSGLFEEMHAFLCIIDEKLKLM